MNGLSSPFSLGDVGMMMMMIIQSFFFKEGLKPPISYDKMGYKRQPNMMISVKLGIVRIMRI
jgi:hypothetical protein